MSKAPYRRRVQHTPKEFKPQTVLKNCFFALLISAPLALLLLGAATFILLKTEDPTRYQDVAGIVVLYLVALACGAISARLTSRQAPVLCGILTGAMLLSVTLIALLFGKQGGTSTAVSFGLHALLLPVCAVGALLGARQKAARRKRHAR